MVLRGHQQDVRALSVGRPVDPDLLETDTIWPRLLAGELADLRLQLADEIALIAPQLLPS